MLVSLAKGTRDFLPVQMRNRMLVMSRVQAVFERFGFEPLGTPALERIETLTGKYGEEGERLMFKILARGDKAAVGAVDMGLRYDLTVPLARVLAMNGDLRMPFKRWQMAPVWRAENPQRGRFREFWQCDVDIAGTTSPLADAECIAVAHAALLELGFSGFVIRVNDRRILRAMVQVIETDAPESSVLIAVDKLDKIGRDGVSAELRGVGLSEASLARLWAILDVPRGHVETLDALDPLLNDDGKAGVAVLREVLSMALAHGVSPDRLQIDPALARGPEYYTGPVFEIEVTEPKIGSISGGGRYDGLVGMFSGRPIPAVGVSLGLERIITVMDELDMFPPPKPTADVLVAICGAECRVYGIHVASQFRAAGVRAELYPDERKLGTQLKHASARGYQWAAIVGPEEMSAGTVTLKDLAYGGQVTMMPDEAALRCRRQPGAAIPTSRRVEQSGS